MLHVVLITVEKPFMCSVCGLDFNFLLQFDKPQESTHKRETMFMYHLWLDRHKGVTTPMQYMWREV